MAGVWYSDGSSLGLACVVSPAGDVIIKFLGEVTNNEAEYHALILAARLASPGSTIFVDSQLVAKQVSGEWKVKSENLRSLRDLAVSIVSSKHLKVKQVPRSKNRAGIVLDRLIHRRFVISFRLSDVDGNRSRWIRAGLPARRVGGGRVPWHG